MLLLSLVVQLGLVGKARRQILSANHLALRITLFKCLNNTKFTSFRPKTMNLKAGRGRYPSILPQPLMPAEFSAKILIHVDSEAMTLRWNFLESIQQSLISFDMTKD